MERKRIIDLWSCCYDVGWVMKRKRNSGKIKPIDFVPIRWKNYGTSWWIIETKRFAGQSIDKQVATISRRNRNEDKGDRKSSKRIEGGPKVSSGNVTCWNYNGRFPPFYNLICKARTTTTAELVIGGPRSLLCSQATTLSLLFNAKVLKLVTR